MAFTVVHDLLSGMENAPGGTASFYLPGTLTQLPVYGDDTGTAITNPVTLDSNGRATVYLSRLARMIVQTIGGSTVLDTNINQDADSLVKVSSDSFTDDTLDEVLDLVQTKFGGTDFNYQPAIGAYAGMSPKTWMNRRGYDVMAFASVTAPNVNDGVTPADTAIAAAVAAAAAAGGGVILLGPGTYLCNSPITVTSQNGISFKGSGSSATTIKNSSTTGNCFTFTSCSTFTLEGFAVANSSTSTAIGVSLVSCTTVRTEDLKVTGHKTGLSVTGTAPANILIGGMSNITAATVDATSRGIVVNPTTAPTAGTFFTCISSYVDGSAAGDAFEFSGAATSCSIIGCDFGVSAIGVLFNAALTGSGFRIAGNVIPSGLPVSFGASPEPVDVYFDHLDIIGRTQDVTSGGTVTPDRSRGSEQRIRGTTTGSAYTINAPTPIPQRRNTRLTLRFHNNAGGAITGWTMNAAYHLSAGPSTTDGQITTYVLLWDADASVWREQSRTVTT